jgi:hypothetical protein
MLYNYGIGLSLFWITGGQKPDERPDSQVGKSKREQL